MDFITAFRLFCANFDIFLAGLIDKIYKLIVDLSYVEISHPDFSKIVNNVYMLLGLFMLFKMAFLVIQYIVSPDAMFTGEKSFSKMIQKIIVCLVMLTAFPAVFTVMKNIQTIILTDNVIPKFILGKNSTSEDVGNAGKEVAYFVFSSFIEYNRTGDLALVFPSDCPNLFLEEDYRMDTRPELIGYCELPAININRCATFLTPYNSEVKYQEYYDACYKSKIEERYDEDGECMYYLNIDSRFDKENESVNNNGEDYIGYYSCKQGARGRAYPTINCGIKNGLYIFQLINKAREERDVASMLSKDVLSAREADPLFVGYYCAPDDKYGEHKDSGGDYVFSYRFLISSIVGIIILIMLIILAVDVAIRTIKLTFLQLIAPIPIVSYIDTKESKLFTTWLKLVINTYLELFIKLATIFLSLFVILFVLNGEIEALEELNDNPTAKILFIVGMFLFAMKIPKLLSEIFGINSDGGIMNIVKGAGKFVLGAGAMTVAGIGGATANLASGIQEKKSAGKTFLSMIGGANSAAIRTLGNQIKNKGNVNLNSISSGIRGSSNARRQNDMGRHIGVRTMDMLREIAGINPPIKMDSKNIENEIEKLKTSQRLNNDVIHSSLVDNENSTKILEAYRVDDNNDRIYETYDDYVNANGSDLSETEYESFARLFDERDEIQRNLIELEKRLEYEKDNETYNSKNSKKK